MITTNRVFIICAVIVIIALILFTNLVTPFDPLHNDGYQFWSGIGANAFLVTWAAIWWRKHNCHVGGCPRLQWHSTAAGDCVCRKHHPDGQPNMIDVTVRHMEAKTDSNKLHNEVMEEIKAIQRAVGIPKK